MTEKKPLAAKGDGRLKVVFHNTQEDTADIFTQVNGVAYQIQREKEVALPPHILQNLDNCVITVFERGAKGEEITRDIKRFPYSRVG